ncbi:hypothetical protein MPH_13258, partial [Macrophomina phaseolina MS6]
RISPNATIRILNPHQHGVRDDLLVGTGIAVTAALLEIPQPSSHADGAIRQNSSKKPRLLILHRSISEMPRGEFVQPRQVFILFLGCLVVRLPSKIRWRGHCEEEIREMADNVFAPVFGHRHSNQPADIGTDNTVLPIAQLLHKGVESYTYFLSA